MNKHMRSSDFPTSSDVSGSTLRQSSSLRAYLPHFPVQRPVLPRNFLRSLRIRTYPKPTEPTSLHTLSTVSLGQFHNSLFSLQRKVKEATSCKHSMQTSNSRILLKSRHAGSLTQRTEQSQVSLQLASNGMQTEEDWLPCAGRERALLPMRLFDWTSIPPRTSTRRVRRFSVLKQPV